MQGILACVCDYSTILSFLRLHSILIVPRFRVGREFWLVTVRAFSTLQGFLRYTAFCYFQVSGLAASFGLCACLYSTLLDFLRLHSVLLFPRVQVGREFLAFVRAYFHVTRLSALTERFATSEIFLLVLISSSFFPPFSG